VAMGIPLHRMPEIRMLYGMDKYGESPINFDQPAVVLPHKPKKKQKKTKTKKRQK
jgi:hypothetical protein